MAAVGRRAGNKIPAIFRSFVNCRLEGEPCRPPRGRCAAAPAIVSHRNRTSGSGRVGLFAHFCSISANGRGKFGAGHRKYEYFQQFSCDGKSRRVVMFVDNPCVNDSRVIKSAEALAATTPWHAGCGVPAGGWAARPRRRGTGSSITASGFPRHGWCACTSKLQALSRPGRRAARDCPGQGPAGLGGRAAAAPRASVVPRAKRALISALQSSHWLNESTGFRAGLRRGTPGRWRPRSCIAMTWAPCRRAWRRLVTLRRQAHLRFP